MTACQKISRKRPTLADRKQIVLPNTVFFRLKLPVSGPFFNRFFLSGKGGTLLAPLAVVIVVVLVLETNLNMDERAARGGRGRGG